MPVYHLNHQIIFPPIDHAEENGLLALGGDLSKKRLILAYESGIFPWYSENQPILWWSPDPRFVLFTDKIHISGSMKRVIRSGAFQFRMNSAFNEVIENCASLPRRGQDGTWISDDMKQAYLKLHHEGKAWSFEAWQDNKLAGGMYGVKCDKYFAGESMFSLVSNASKYALIEACRYLMEIKIAILDCQIHSGHLERMGATYISRKQFENFLTVRHESQ